MLTVTAVESSASRFRPILVSTILLFTLFVHLLLVGLSPQFEKVFAGFDRELPFFTQLFLPGSFIYSVLPAICLIAFLIYWTKPKPAMKVLITCAIGTLIMIPATVIAVYLPVYQLGKAVGT